MDVPSEAEVLDKLGAWGEAHASIRAMILTSSRAKPDGGADALSDYDVIIAVRDTTEFTASDSWISAYGEPLARWGDESELYGLPTHFRGVVYRDLARVDYTIWPKELLPLVADRAELPEDLDVGYRVLLDKDGETTRWQAPTYRAHIPARPTEAEYQALLEEFWWDTTYVAKALWRGELFFAKFVLECDVKSGALRRFLEWRIQLDHDWSLKPGAYGRGLERLLPEDVWSQLASTYVGTGVEENWSALFRTISVFRRVATDVGHALGHAYPQDIDDAMIAFLEGVRGLPRGRAG